MKDANFMLKQITHIAVAGLLFLSVQAYADPSRVRSYQLAQHGSLQLSVPSAWNDQMREGQPGTPPILLFKPEHGSGFNVQVTPLWPAKPNDSLPSLEQIKLTVTKGADDEKAQAVETDIPIQEIQGTSGSGYYFTVTDRAPKPDEFKYMARGMLCVGKTVLAFTILSNDGTQSAIVDALTMLKGARLVKTAKH